MKISTEIQHTAMQKTQPEEVKIPSMEAKNSLIWRLRNSELFQSYRNVFRNLTGLPLDIRSVGSQQMDGELDVSGGSKFCRLLNGGGNRCQQCAKTHCGLSSNESRVVKSIQCFAGLSETAVPVMHSGAVVAQMITGHVFLKKKTKEDFDESVRMIGEDVGRRAELERAYLETPVVSEAKYRAMTTLLAAFSLQLGELAGQIILELRHEKSDCIACAKDYIDEKIHEPIVLDEVASEVHMSRYYLCRKFKECTGMTLTEYTSKRRIEIAKEMLINSSLRVADIAFEVGFQSLSQFNRCFLKITQITPTEFKRSANDNYWFTEQQSAHRSRQNRVRIFDKPNPI